MKRKDTKKLVLYMIPVVALVIGNFIGVDDPTNLENSLEVLFYAVMGVLTAVGVVKNNDKDDSSGEE